MAVERPTESSIKSAWAAVIRDPLLSPERLRLHALQTGLSAEGGVGLRSVYWRIFLGLLPPPRSSDTDFSTSWLQALEHARAEWDSLRERYLRSPDGHWIDDGAAPVGSTASMSRQASSGGKGKARAVDGLDPLSLDKASPWGQHFADLDSRAEIRRDTERTFPDIEAFREPRVQDALTNILHVWAKLNSGIGYRQGMHELLAMLLLAVDLDSLPREPDTADDLMATVLDRDAVEHDAWALFVALMRPAAAFFDPTNSAVLPLSPEKASALGRPIGDQVAHVQAIHARSVHIHDGLLQRVDPELWRQLEKLGIEPQIWGIRWLCVLDALCLADPRRRLLFSREFPFDDTLLLWDALLAEDPTLRLVDQICIVMLLRIRDGSASAALPSSLTIGVIGADYSLALQLLLRYPTPPCGQHQTSRLVQQAIRLRDSPSPATATDIRRENVELGLATIAPPSSPTTPRHSHHRRAESALPGGRRPNAAGLIATGGGLVGGLASGVYERAEALGLNRALLGAYGDLRKNVIGGTAAVPDASSFPPRFAEPPRRTFARPISPTVRPEASASAAGRPDVAAAIGSVIDVLEEHAGSGSETVLAIGALRHLRDVVAGSVPLESAMIGSLSKLISRPAVDSPTTPTVAVASPRPTAVAASSSRGIQPSRSSVPHRPIPARKLTPSPPPPAPAVRALYEDPSDDLFKSSLWERPPVRAPLSPVLPDAPLPPKRSPTLSAADGPDPLGAVR